MYLKELLQKPILSLYEGEILGNINKIYFEKSRKKIIILELIGNEDLTYHLHTKYIYTIGKHAITIKNKQNLVLALEDTPMSVLPLDVKVYSIQGEYLGSINDYIINDKYELQSMVLENQQILPISDIASCSANSVVVYYSDEHINIKTFRYRIQNKNTRSNKVKVLPKLFSSFNKIVPTPNNKKNSFIIGRVCTQDIYDSKQNLIIKQNSTITEKVLAVASEKNKLNDLMKFSKPKQ